MEDVRTLDPDKHKLAPAMAVCIESEMRMAEHMEGFGESIAKLTLACESIAKTTEALNFAIGGNKAMNQKGMMDHIRDLFKRQSRIEKYFLMSIGGAGVLIFLHRDKLIELFNK